MPGRPHSEEESGAAAALRAVGNGCLLAAGAICTAALLGLSPAIGPGSVGVACWLGIGCWLGADALQNTALLADAERQRRAEAEEERAEAALLALEREMAGLDAAKAETPQERSQHFVALIERQRRHEAGGRGF